RWTSSALALHDTALAGFRRFFKSFAGLVQLPKISAVESTAALTAGDRKAIVEARAQLDKCLTDLHEAEAAHDLLLTRYPAVPSVTTTVVRFRRQFFRQVHDADGK